MSAKNFQQDCKAFNNGIVIGSLQIVKYWVEDRGANINLKDDLSKNALYCAACTGATNIARYLVEECGTDVNGKDTDDWTMLHVTVFMGSVEIIKYLVEQGADVDSAAQCCK